MHYCYTLSSLYVQTQEYFQLFGLHGGGGGLQEADAITHHNKSVLQ